MKFVIKTHIENSATRRMERVLHTSTFTFDQRKLCNLSIFNFHKLSKIHCLQVRVNQSSARQLSKD